MYFSTGLFVIPISFGPRHSVYTEYLEFLVAAETYGFNEVFIGEHLTDPHENIQSSMIFAAALLAKTKRLNVSLSVLPLTHYHIPLLVKQLEDLYLLSQDRLRIGFSPGALNSDLEYLELDPALRYQIFCEKIDQFFQYVDNSLILSNMQKNRFFSTLLSPLPVNANKLFSQGYSALSSNFSHSSHLHSHYKCLTKNSLEKNSSKWHIGVNYINDIDKISNHSKETVIKSLTYIYNKLNVNATKIMLPTIKESPNQMTPEAFNNVLLEEQIVSKYDLMKIVPSVSYPEIASIVVNLFDCLSDPYYTKGILEFPEETCNWTPQ